ncbi:MAG: hypothetical protein ACREQI_13545 [Candidatus Binataceae bacterium]
MALPVYYWHEWLDMGRQLASGKGLTRRLLYLLVVASASGEIAGDRFAKEAGMLFRSSTLIAPTTTNSGALLWIANKSDAQSSAIQKVFLLTAGRIAPGAWLRNLEN